MNVSMGSIKIKGIANTILIDSSKKNIIMLMFNPNTKIHIENINEMIVKPMLEISHSALMLYKYLKVLMIIRVF
jgi:hypothetical protein